MFLLREQKSLCKDLFYSRVLLDVYCFYSSVKSVTNIMHFYSSLPPPLLICSPSKGPRGNCDVEWTPPYGGRWSLRNHRSGIRRLTAFHCGNVLHPDFFLNPPMGSVITEGGVVRLR